MKTGEELNLSARVASVLKYIEYSAVSLLSVAVIIHLLNPTSTMILNVIGTALVALAPAVGVLTVAILSIKKGNRDLLLFSAIILTVYLAAFLLAR